jgi:hypothetical protein
MRALRATQAGGEFAWRRKARSQRDNYCRTCRADYKRQHYSAHRERYVANAAQRKRTPARERASLLVAFFRDRPCVDCGETDPLVLGSTTSRTRASTSPRESATIVGSRSSTRSASARSFVQTVIVGVPPCEAGSRARW